MLRAAVAFFVVAVIAAILGFGGLASGAADVAVILFWAFVVLAAVSLVVGLMRR